MVNMCNLLHMFVLSWFSCTKVKLLSPKDAKEHVKKYLRPPSQTLTSGQSLASAYQPLLSFILPTSGTAASLLVFKQLQIIVHSISSTALTLHTSVVEISPP